MFLDIVAYVKGHALDSFAALSRLYYLHISAQENKFLVPDGDPIVNAVDNTKLDITLKFILLPHQILILPVDFVEKIGFDEAQYLEQIDKDDIR